MKYYQRKSIRLKGFDYSQPGGYFVTMCTHRREPILGEIIDGAMQLSELGEIAQMCWKNIPVHFEGVRLDAFQVMPNHLHGILAIEEGPEQRIVPAQIVGVEYIQLQRTRHDRPAAEHRYQHVIPKSLGSIIRSYKAAVTREARQRAKCGDAPLWQRDFYDRVIRNPGELTRIRRYIENNPLAWSIDGNNPDKPGQTADEDVF